MKKTELREFVGILAIFLGLVFVGLEMRQNTKMMRAQIRNSMTENTMEYVGWSATSEALAEAVAINRQEGAAELTPSQYHMVRAWAGAQMREWENSFYQNKLGLFTEAEFGARKNIWRQRMTTGARSEIYRRLWMDLAETFAPDFRDEIDRIIAAEKT